MFPLLQKHKWSFCWANPALKDKMWVSKIIVCCTCIGCLLGLANLSKSGTSYTWNQEPWLYNKRCLSHKWEFPNCVGPEGYLDLCAWMMLNPMLCLPCWACELMLMFSKTAPTCCLSEGIRRSKPEHCHSLSRFKKCAIVCWMPKFMQICKEIVKILCLLLQNWIKCCSVK